MWRQGFYVPSSNANVCNSQMWVVSGDAGVEEIVKAVFEQIML